MKYLKYFESNEVSVEDKVKAIIDMYKFMCERRDIKDGCNFIGECSSLLRECGIRTRIRTGDRMIYETDINKVVNSLNSSRFGIERSEKIEELYPFAKEIYGNKTIDDVQKLIQPIIDNSNVIDGEIYEKDWFWRKHDGIQAFCFDFKLDPEIHIMDEDDVMGKGHGGESHWLDKEKIPKQKEALKIFRRYEEIFKGEIRKARLKSNGLRYELHDSLHFNDIYSIRLLILPIE